jgi:hypothetical protein
MRSTRREKALKYALLIHDKPGAYDALSPSEYESVFGEYFAISQAPGVYGGAQLQGVETATTVRVEDGATLTTDGPGQASRPAPRPPAHVRTECGEANVGRCG